jgi:hypothetical protein
MNADEITDAGDAVSHVAGSLGRLQLAARDRFPADASSL